MTTTLLERVPPAARRAAAGHRGVLVVALVAIVLQTAMRGALAFGSGFYWDDLILVGRAGSFPLLSDEFLRYDHDGHLMPGAFLVAGLATALAPLQWWPAATTLVAGQLLASLAVLRVLWLLLGGRRALWAPLLFYLLTPLTLPAFAWWAAALNSLPLQAALAWVAGDALQYTRTRRRRYLVSAPLVTAVALFFFEKAVLVPFVALATVALVGLVDGHSRPLRAALYRGRPLWIASAVVLTVWLGVYLTTVESRFGVPEAGMAGALTHQGLSFGLVPTLAGGPWRWDRWNPGPPWADPPIALAVVSWIVVVCVLVWSVRRLPRTGWVWGAVAMYVAASLIAMIGTRAGPDTSYTLARTLRYFADSAVVFAIAGAVVLRAPARPSRRPLPAPVRTAVAGTLLAVFTVGSVGSTITFARSWADNPTGDYLTTARAGLTARPDVPILDHPVSVWVLLPVAFPHNLLGSVFSALPGRAEITDTTTELQVLDERGALVPADLLAVRWFGPGPVPGCGHEVLPGATTVVPTGEMLDATWTVQLDYLASEDGFVEVGFPSSEPTRVAVTAGPGTVYARVPGGGAGVQIRSSASGPGLCIGAGAVGVVAPR